MLWPFAGFYLLQFAVLVGALVFDPTQDSIPSYVVEFSPLVYLYTEEKYHPGAIEEYVRHFHVSTADLNSTKKLDITQLNAQGRRLRRQVGNPTENLYLSARHQWGDDPEWLTAENNKPSLQSGRIENSASTVIVVDKGSHVDAFWFYFYPFNEGPYVMGQGPYGNHLGDWEHSLVRFKDGKPQILWMSAHGGGAAYHWEGLDPAPFTSRPAIYAARGTHANYVSVGQHSHDIPWHILSDFSDRGALWDPAKNFLAYTFDGQTVRPANGSEPGRENRFGDWLLYDGCWGNKQLICTDVRQSWSPWQWKIIDGPQGPLFKNLMRDQPCERHKWWNIFGVCRIRHRVTPGEGIEADMLPCPLILGFFPGWLRYPASFIFSGGYLCYFLDLVWG